MLIKEAIDKINKIQSQTSLNSSCIIVGIDGPGGSGKSTLAKQLAKHFDATLIHSDDFYKTEERRNGKHSSDQIVSDKFDWNLLEKKVFNKKPGEIIKYRPYSWEISGLLPEINHKLKDIIIIEGIYALQQRFLDKYHVKIWVEVSESVRLERGVKRDGEHMREAWETIWLPQDKRYFDSHRPDQKADVIIINN